MTQREANADLLAEIAALRDRVASQGRQIAQAHEHEAATSEILRLISSSPIDVQPVFEAIAAKAQDLCKAKTGTVFTFDGERIHIGEAHSLSAEAVQTLRQTYPMALSRGGATARAILSCTIVYIPDIREDPEYGHQTLAKAVGYLSALAVPMLHDGKPIGAITVTGAEAGAFSQTQIELLKTFADQAIIAIENVRLFTELGKRNRDLTEALDQQTATSEILRVSRSSPTDPQPVFDAVVRNGARLCEAANASLHLREGEIMRKVAEFGHVSTRLRIGETRPITRTTVTGRAMIEGRPINIGDLHGAGMDTEYPDSRHIPETRACLGIPLLREDGGTVGALFIFRTENRPFTEKHVGLLQTFADQAVIAIENVRLFNETKEALEQQTATSEILRVISSSPTDVQPVFDAVAASAARLCGADDAVIQQVDGGVLKLVAHFGGMLAPPEDDPMPITRDMAVGCAVLDRRTMHVHDMAEEHRRGNYPASRSLRGRLGYRTLLCVPLVRQDVAVGVIVMRRGEVQPFTDQQISLVQTFADQAVIAIVNVRLFNDIKEALEQQTATSDILRVISTSPTDLQPVLEAVAKSAARFCGADDAIILQLDGAHLRAAAHQGPIPVDFNVPVPCVPGTVGGRSVLERRAIHVTDLQAETQEFPEGSALAKHFGHRTTLGVPLLREGTAIGTIQLRRLEANRFTDKQTALLQTFANQAVIAIENVRLFKELEARNRELTTALDRQTATADVLRIIAQSPTDLQPVLDAIATSAMRLCEASDAVIERLEDDRFYNAAHAGTQMKGLVGLPLPLTRRFPGGRAILDRTPIIIEDIQLVAESEYPDTLELLKLNTIHSVAEIPLLSEGKPLGSLAVLRAEMRPFTEAEVALLKTFADQAVIAIENVRLFKELQAANRELAAASQHKSEFLANMSHELRTPLNAIIGFSEVLSDRMFGELNDKQEEYLMDIYASGTHLLSLINDILDLSKIEAGRMELELTDFDLPTAVENALMLVRERAGRRSIALHTNIDSRLGQIQADERKVRQVVLNLLSNAIKFTPERGRIDVGAVPKDGFVEVSVSDTGIGIAPEDQEKVFEEFRQVGTAAKKVEGTGLGLTLCRKFVELHGGKIWVKSQMGEGSTFTFTLPVRRGE
jgi:signal transduction histidine kinase